MCCARHRRSESAPMTMPRIGCKCDRRGDNATDSKSADAVVSVPLLSLYDCVKVRWGNHPMMRLLLAAAIVLPCLGCASVTRGTTENISVSTTPAGATADISGLEIPTACVTPCVVVAKRNADITVTINKEGYEPQIIPLTKEIPGSGAAGFAGNILAGGLIGMGVDAATGAAQDHKPNPVIVTLQPLEPVPPRAVTPRRPKRPPPQS